MSRTATGGRFFRCIRTHWFPPVERNVQAELAAYVEQLGVFRIFLHDPDVVGLMADCR